MTPELLEMEFTASNQNGHLTILIDTNRLTSANASGLTQIVRPALPKLKSVTVDCRRLNLVDSGGLVGLVMLAKLIDAEGLEPATIKNLNSSVEKLIRLSHLENHFRLDANNVGQL